MRFRRRRCEHDDLWYHLAGPFWKAVCRKCKRVRVEEAEQ